jgi:hypothetical protein
MPSFRTSLVLVTALAALAFTPACAASADDAAVTGDDANLTQLASSDVKVEGKPVDFGTSRKFSATVKDKVRIHAVPFAGNAGDAVTAESHSTWGGTLYVLKKVSTHYVAVTSVKTTARKRGDLSVTLKTGGDFFLGFEATAPKTATKSASATVTLKLGGTAAPIADSSFLGKLKTTYENDANDPFVEINEGDLPAGAKKDWNKYNKDWGGDYPPVAYSWQLEGKTLYVVEEDTDGGMFIDFFDSSGKQITGGSASESGPFIWQ